MVALMLLAAVVLVSPVSAEDTAPVFPHAFKGDVLVNGNPAPDGYTVSATVSEGVIATGSQNPVTTTDGSYGKDGALFLLVQGDIPTGATIYFYVNGVKASSTAEYEPGNVDSVDLSVSITPPSPGGGGGGGSYIPPATPVTEFTTTGMLQTDSTGAVQSSVIIYAADKLSSVYIGEGVQALQANGQPVVDITIQETQNVPSPGVSTFVFAGHAVKVGPAGATFSPAIELTFQLTEEEWNALKPGESFTIKWFNDGTGEWEDIPTTVNPYTHTVIGEITHFSTFAVFKQVVEEPTTVVTETPTVSPGETPVATATPTEPVSDGGFPWIWVIVVIVIIAAIGGGYYYMQQKND